MDMTTVLFVQNVPLFLIVAIASTLTNRCVLAWYGHHYWWGARTLSLMLASIFLFTIPTPAEHTAVLQGMLVGGVSALVGHFLESDHSLTWDWIKAKLSYVLRLMRHSSKG